MRPLEQVPRNALVWIIITQFALLLPHVLRVPAWVCAVYLGAALWRAGVYRGQWSFPPAWLRGVLAVTCAFGVYLSYRTVLGLEPTVALLLVAFALKLLELVRRKDAYLLIFLGYFVCTTEFLFSQELPVSLYNLFCVLLLTTSLIALHQPGENTFNRRTIGKAALIMAQALPLMVVLFLVFPRLDPLWNVPLKSQSARTGVSDFMKPGDITRLGLSDEVAFRVQFDGDIPPKSQLYWRTLVMSKLDEGAWRSLRYRDVPVQERRPQDPERSGERVSYEVIMEPTRQRWLFALRYAEPVTSGILRHNDYRLSSPQEIEDEYQYRVNSWPATRLDPELSDWRRQVELALPEEDNPLTRQLAMQFRAETDSDQDFIERVLRHFRQEAFHYTLRPPALGDDPLDDFLFNTRRGFCEHYASAFVTLARAGGIPARVVTGYQGGEINPVNRTVIVHQFDAHAWAEVWYPGSGWTRVDPTAAVAPERVERGLEQALAQEGSFLADSPLSPLRFRGVQWVNTLRLRYDALTYSWQRLVLGYDQRSQYEFLQGLLGKVEPLRLAALLLGSWLLVLLPLALVLWWRNAQHSLSPADRAYRLFCTRLGKLDLGREASESPSGYATRISEQRPDLAGVVWRITALYERISYGAGGQSAPLLASLRREVSAFRPR